MHELLTGTTVHEPDLLLRSDDEGNPTLAGLVMPYRTVVPIGQGVYETIAPGALRKTVSERGAQIPLHSLHTRESPSQPIGLATSWDLDNEVGAYATFRLANTTASRDAQELIRQQIVTGLSAGFYDVRSAEIRRHNGGPVFERQEIRLDHVALVMQPAYDDARVLAVREQWALADLEAEDSAAMDRLAKWKRELHLD